MPQYVSIIFVLCLFFGGKPNESSFKQKIEAVEVCDSSPTFGETFYKVFYAGPFVVYQSQYLFDSSIKQLKFDSSSNQMLPGTIQTKSVWRSQFFVFHQDSAYGYSYDPYGGSGNNRRMAVDYKLRSIKGTNQFEKLLDQKPDSTMWSQGRTKLKEIYIAKGNKDTPTVHLNLYYSRKLNHLKESLNPVLDSVKKMKLYKTEILVEEFYSEKDKKKWPLIKSYTEMKEKTVDNAEEIMDYINKYKQSTGVYK